MADREDVIRKVQALWARADHPNTPEAERDSCLRKASELMAKWEIQELELAVATATEEAIVLADIRLFRDGAEVIVTDQRMKLAHYIATHHRCLGVITHLPASVDADGRPVFAGQYYRMVGYKSDTITVRTLYQGLVVDMLDALSQEPVGHLGKRELAVYQANFCDGFADRVDSRLSEIERRIEKMAERKGDLLPALRSRLDKVKDEFNRMYPDLEQHKMKRYQYDPNARARGARAADGSDVGQTKVGGARKELT